MRLSNPARLTVLVLLCLTGLVIVACASTEDTTEAITAQWAASAHANVESRSFRLWDTREPPEISTRCAKCHSTSGYLDFLGADDSTPGEVDQAASIGIYDGVPAPWPTQQLKPKKKRVLEPA